MLAPGFALDEQLKDNDLSIGSYPDLNAPTVFQKLAFELWSYGLGYEIFLRAGDGFPINPNPLFTGLFTRGVPEFVCLIPQVCGDITQG